MTFRCSKGHESTDSDYCSECGSLIGLSEVAKIEAVQSFNLTNTSGVSGNHQELCPDCKTPRVGSERFCEVCRHDFQDNKAGAAEVIVASQKSIDDKNISLPEEIPESMLIPDTGTGMGMGNIASTPGQSSNNLWDGNNVLVKLNIVISVDRDKAVNSGIKTSVIPDTRERVFPLDLDENLVGRRSNNKGIYPEIEINDAGVSHRHLKFIKQPDGNFIVLELGSANGTELNGVHLEPGVSTAVKAGDELTIGIWTKLKLVPR